MSSFDNQIHCEELDPSVFATDEERLEWEAFLREESEADVDYEDDGQPDEYTEWQDLYGGDDWDHGQYDDC